MQTRIPREKLICDNFINGSWVKGSAGHTDVVSPYNGQLIGTITHPSAQQVDDAI